MGLTLKRGRSNPTQEAIDTVVTELLAFIDEGPQGDLSAEQLTLIKSYLLIARDHHNIHKPAEEFTLDEVVQLFELNYSSVVSHATVMAHVWKIEDVKLDFPMTPCFPSLVENYSKNFDHSSKAVCRTALDFILNECLTVLKGNHVGGESQGTSDCRQTAPQPYSKIKAYAYLCLHGDLTGCLDYSVGCVIPTIHAGLERHFQCLLVIVEAKTRYLVGQVLSELLVYFACLRQSRIQQHQTDASAYGVASDGYKFLFVKITHDGTVMISKQFDVQLGQTLEILRCLRYILEMTVEINDNLTPEMNGMGDFADPDLYDNDYTNQPDDDKEMY